MVTLSPICSGCIRAFERINCSRLPAVFWDCFRTACRKALWRSKSMEADAKQLLSSVGTANCSWLGVSAEAETEEQKINGALTLPKLTGHIFYENEGTLITFLGWAGLDIKACPHARGMYICPRAHKLLRLHARLSKWFLSQAMYFFPAVYISFTGLVHILAGQVNFPPIARWACKPNA